MSSGFFGRLLLGDAPGLFLLEVLARTLLIYAALLVILRLLGKRMSGRLGNWELAVMIALGAIVSAPFQDPSHGVLTGLLLLLLLLALQRSMSALAARFATVEEAAHGPATLLVADGVLELSELRAAHISVPQLFAVLRSRGLRQLGQIKRVYLEGHGDFSVLLEEPAKPGLSLLPDWDDQPGDLMGNPAPHRACRACGRLVAETEFAPRLPCPSCQAADWTTATVNP